jgi:hypothetical protein
MIVVADKLLKKIDCLLTLMIENSLTPRLQIATHDQRDVCSVVADNFNYNIYTNLVIDKSFNKNVVNNKVYNNRKINKYLDLN